MKDLYSVLGVNATADAEAIKSAYRKLARENHPDANPGDTAAEERFKEISHAYDVLGDAEKRSAYDAERASPFARAGAGGGPRTGGGGPFGNIDVDLGDLFGSVFSRGGGAGPRPARGADIETEVTISFDQAMEGVTVPIALDKRDACSTCRGSGAKPGTSSSLCPECRGRGVRGREAGGFSVNRPCANCGGAGTIIETPCEDCGGAGSTSGRKRYNVKIPAGAKSGTKVRLRGKGQAGPAGTEPGDLFVVVAVGESERYTRAGDNLVIEVPITFAEAAMGAKVEIPTLDGKVAITVPPGSTDGRRLAVRGKGAPRMSGSGAGDLIATLRIVVPEKLGKRQKDALQKFADLDKRDPREALFT